MIHASNDWSPASWRARTARHLPVYDDGMALEAALARLQALPPLVLAEDVERLKAALGGAARGEAVVLQAGDCAETFDGCTSAALGAQTRLISDLARVMADATALPVVKIGRLAGQYAKPRSAETELFGGLRAPSFLGENINSFNILERRPDPRRLIDAYFHAAATLNALALLAPDRDLFTSHEGLHLPSEESQTRYVASLGAWYNLSAHLLWIGERTRALDEAHVEYFRGIANPIGIKVGPGADPAAIIALTNRLDPRNVAGKIVLITRYGADAAAAPDGLARLVGAVSAARRRVVWLCDPMHGNTRTAANGYKTRAVEDLVTEVRETRDVHAASGRPLGGLHLETSGEPVTECTGGPEGLTAEDLPRRYLTRCDPRLNRAQALEVVAAIAGARDLASQLYSSTEHRSPPTNQQQRTIS